MPRVPDKCRLLHGPYHAPALRRGDRAECLLRGTVVITSWTDARISWPRCRRPVGNSHSSLLVDEELARAVRTEAAAAVRYWWGVSHGVMEKWRKALDVTRTNSPGTHRLQRASAQAGAAVIKTREWKEDERQQRREAELRNNLGRFLWHGYHGPRWTKAQERLLGTLPDAEVAARVGRTVGAVRQKRNLAGIPTARDGRHRKMPEGRAGGAEK